MARLLFFRCVSAVLMRDGWGFACDGGGSLQVLFRNPLQSRDARRVGAARSAEHRIAFGFGAGCWRPRLPRGFAGQARRCSSSIVSRARARS